MNPSASGWFKAYCELRTEVNSDEQLLSSKEQLIYRIFQPTGLMYGHPVQHPKDMSIDQWDAVDRMKLIFAESLLHMGEHNLGFEHNDESSPETSAEAHEHLIIEINDYFLNIYPHLYQGKLDSSLKDPYYLAEKIINRRITIQTSLLKNYLAHLFHNSLLFLDVFYFGEWVKSLGSANSKRLRQEKESMRLAILEIMAIAAHADEQIQKEERSLFEFFLNSANLSPEKQQMARTLLETPTALDEIIVPPVESWVLRKYLLEMAILVTWADRDMSSSEQEVIRQLGHKLGFSEEEVGRSMLAVESFVLDNWNGMHYLLGKHNLERVSSRFVNRLKSFINKNKDYVVQEIQESKELVALLGKSRRTTLTEAEKQVVTKQLRDILKTIPPIVIIALPFTFITLPIMLSILPPSAFPSAFQE